MYLINCGSFQSDGGVMYGGIPRRVWQRADRPDTENRCRMAVNVALVRLKDRVVLMDCGVGDVHERYLKGYGFEGQWALHRRLSDDCNIRCEEVTDVILSHLHFDHCGGAVRRDDRGVLIPTFPNAVHWVSAAQYSYAFSPSALDDDSFVEEDICCLSKNTDWRIVTQSMQVSPELSLHLYDGHSFGQIVTEFHTEKGAFLFTGDTIPTKNHFKKRWGSGYDLEPLKTLDSKQSIAALAIRLNAGLIFPHEKGYPLAYCHSKGGDYRLIESSAQEHPFQYIP